jgi:23S rRNA (guanosine2251-2'-O)-methyltransferase
MKGNIKEVVVVLEDVRSTFNVGSVLRTADGAGCKTVYMCGITPDGNHPKVVKTALGAEKFINWVHTKDTAELLKTLKNDGYQLISVEQAENSEDYRKIEYTDKVAFIFGNEITGVSKIALEASDHIAEIPMLGKKNSLNVSTTTGIILYNAVP